MDFAVFVTAHASWIWKAPSLDQTPFELRKDLLTFAYQFIVFALHDASKVHQSFKTSRCLAPKNAQLSQLVKKSKPKVML
jgi:hypothetical protein